MKDCNVLVYGGGAVGSIFAWRIAQQTQTRVSVVCRSNHDIVKRNGFFFRTQAWGNGHFRPHRVYTSNNIAHHPSQPFDYIVCANKVTRDNPRSILNDLRHVVNPYTTLVSAQNGMSVENPFREAFPSNTILSAICNIGCSQNAGQVEQNAGVNPKAFQIGIFSGSVHGPTHDVAVRDHLVSFDSRFGSIDDVFTQRWKKLIFNCVMNASSALTNLNTHEVLSNPDALMLATKLAHEVCHLARRAGVKLEADYASTIFEMARKSHAITPSTLQDARHKRSMEVSSIWGWLIDKAAACNLAVPFISLAHDLLEEMNASFMKEQDLVARRHMSTSLAAWPDTKIINAAFAAHSLDRAVLA